ncbi:MAG: hypothetical protein JWO26_1849 [Rhodospirillales bacterium]|jgi:alpha-1,2-mannosyltransferase|nr:hypothetical protein [Rhodospirillales bacterium]
MNPTSSLRDATWLRPDIARAFGLMLLICFAALAASIPWTDPARHVAGDFAAFWTAANFAIQGDLAAAYGARGSEAVAAVFGPGIYAPLFYPPTALLIWLPFAFLPFAAAAALWLTGTGIAYLAAVRKIACGHLAILAAFPSVALCGLYGQNSLLSAALLAGAAVTLDQRPIVAGALLGCLAYKPQLAILAPLLLALAGRWHAFVSVAVTAASLVAASALAFGVEPWLAFISGLPAAKAWFTEGAPGFGMFASPYAAMRLLGASAGTAWAAQTVAGVAAVAGMLWLARRRPGGAAEISAMVVATGFCVPSLGEYDLVIFAVPAAWLAAEAVRNGWLPYERVGLAVLYLAPLFISGTEAHGVPVAPVALAALAYLVGRRVALGLPVYTSAPSPRRYSVSTSASPFTPPLNRRRTPATSPSSASGLQPAAAQK